MWNQLQQMASYYSEEPVVKKPKYLYHATMSDRLGGIQQKGLIPSEEEMTHWGGDLGAYSYGKVMMDLRPEGALYYGNIVMRRNLEAHGVSQEPILLRINTDGITSKLIRTEKRGNEVWTDQMILPQYIEFWHHMKWVPIVSASYAGDLQDDYRVEETEWDPEEQDFLTFVNSRIDEYYPSKNKVKKNAMAEWYKFEPTIKMGMWNQLKIIAQSKMIQPWQMTKAEFEKALEYHGSPQKDIQALQRYMKGGGDMGGIFTTPHKDYARIYMGWDGKLYYTFTKNKRILDLTNRKNVDKIRGWIGELYTVDDEEIPFTQNDFEFMFPTPKGADWATFSHYEDLFMRHGYDGLRIYERYYPVIKSTVLFEGNVPVWDEEQNVSDIHRSVVEQALREGKEVPEKVLNEYPNLVKIER